MRRLALAGAAAVGAAAFLLITQQAGSGPEFAAGSPPARGSARPPILADRTTATFQEHQAPKDRSPVPLSIRNDLTLALGSEQSDLLALFRKGTRAGATAGEQFAAYQIVALCYFSIRRMQYPEIPGVSGDTVREVDEARARQTRRCSGIERIGIDQILRDYEVLRGVVGGGPRSPPTFIRARNDAERTVAVAGLGDVFSEFGPVALLWSAGDVVDYLRLGTTPFARQIREMSGNEDMVDYAVYLAMCKGSDICGEGGLLYLSNCSDTGRCGGSLLNAYFGQVTPEQSQLAQPIAQKILDAIRTGEWTAR
jgi:hypothetical protein